jgi:hypothetical protein
VSQTGKLPLFQQYQLQFSAHIRNPDGVARPQRVSAERMRVYRTLVFDNLDATLGACFPVCKRVLGKRRWRQLVRSFLVHHRATSPLFRQIPEEFLAFLQTLPEIAGSPELPPFFNSLAHYEWVELAVSAAETPNLAADVDAAGDLLQSRPVLAGALMLLTYDYPVQRISPRFKPQEPLQTPVDLLVFRDAADQVRFVELNAVTARLVALLQTQTLTGLQALEHIAVELAHPQPQILIDFGSRVLADLRAQGAIIGVRWMAV